MNNTLKVKKVTKKIICCFEFIHYSQYENVGAKENPASPPQINSFQRGLRRAIVFVFLKPGEVSKRKFSLSWPDRPGERRLVAPAG